MRVSRRTQAHRTVFPLHYSMILDRAVRYTAAAFSAPAYHSTESRARTRPIGTAAVIIHVRSRSRVRRSDSWRSDVSRDADNRRNDGFRFGTPRGPAHPR